MQGSRLRAKRGSNPTGDEAPVLLQRLRGTVRGAIPPHPPGRPRRRLRPDFVRLGGLVHNLRRRVLWIHGRMRTRRLDASHVMGSVSSMGPSPGRGWNHAGRQPGPALVPRGVAGHIVFGRARGAGRSTPCAVRVGTTNPDVIKRIGHRSQASPRGGWSLGPAWGVANRNERHGRRGNDFWMLRDAGRRGSRAGRTPGGSMRGRGASRVLGAPPLE